MHPATLLAFIALDTVLCFVPGPAVLGVVGAALTRERTGYATALGIRGLLSKAIAHDKFAALRAILTPAQGGRAAGSRVRSRS